MTMWLLIFALAYGAVFYLGEQLSYRLHHPHSITLVGMIVLGSAAIAAAQRKYHFAWKRPIPFYACFPALLWVLWDFAYGSAPASSLPWTEICLGAVCGMIEEVAFRGCLWNEIRLKNPILAAVFNSLLFGLFHCASLIGEAPPAAWLQTLCAVSAGLLFCGITVFCGSILPAMVLHGGINLAGGLFYVETPEPKGLLLLALSIVCSTLTGIGLIIRSTKERETKHEVLH